MRFYTQQHVHYCGIDLHARSLYLCILDQEGNTLVHRKLPCDRELLTKALAPYRKDQVVAVECLFCWYWVAYSWLVAAFRTAAGHVRKCGWEAAGGPARINQVFRDESRA